MSALVWDLSGTRVYETGIDRGVLYLPDGSAVAWNGLTSITEEFDRESNPVYYDGMKIMDLVELGDFSGSIKAMTYPDEFEAIEGMRSSRPGMMFGDQPPQTFGLCYRTTIGNDLTSALGYKLHILYNVTAIPKDKEYVTLSDSPELIEFEWEISAVPEEVTGFRPTAHMVINSVDFDPWLLAEVEAMLYGTDDAPPSLVSMQDLVSYINAWYRIKIIDHGDGTWTADSKDDSLISVLPDNSFTITQANAVYSDADTFTISDTDDITEVT